MSVPILPDSAPFSPSQRAWINGFLAGMLSLESASPASTPAAEPIAASEPVAANDSADEFPWHDPALALDERIELAQGRPLEQQLMAAMAQLDCGTCGYTCSKYAQAIAGGDERSLTRCTPGGRETARRLKELMI